MFTSKRTVIVEWGDCDPANIVFYPRYFAWFNESTGRHFAAAGLPKPELIRRYGVVGFPMVDTRAKFHVPSSHGDEVVIETSALESKVPVPVIVPAFHVVSPEAPMVESVEKVPFV